MTVRSLCTVGLVLASAPFLADANKGHDDLASLSEKARNQRLTVMLSQLPEPCVAQRNFFRGFDKNRALWSVECTNNKACTLMIDDDAAGSTRIMDCKVLMERAQVDCFAKL